MPSEYLQAFSAVRSILYGSNYLIHGTLQSFPHETYPMYFTLTTLCETLSFLSFSDASIAGSLV